MVKDAFNIKMETNMKETGRKIKLMDSESTLIRTVQLTKASGSLI